MQISVRMNDLANYFRVRGGGEFKIQVRFNISKVVRGCMEPSDHVCVLCMVMGTWVEIVAPFCLMGGLPLILHAFADLE